MTTTVTFGVTEKIYSLGTYSRTDYGIAAYAEIDGTATVVLAVHDVTSDKKSFRHLQIPAID